MLFQLNPANKIISKTKKVPLKAIDWLEQDLQELMFSKLDELLPEEELLLIGQSRKWQEEPDLIAVDKEGALYIFELKAWESQDFNLLQVMRYGQIYGQYDYDALNHRYRITRPSSPGLLEDVNQKFSINLEKHQINQRQKFILITNGLDYKTRQAIEYWSQQGIQIDAWIYRVHQVGRDTLLEFETFQKSENPFEDLPEGYYILNTNRQDGPRDEKDMLREHKAAAFFPPWKFKIEKINKGDKVFLYRSGEGIIAMGKGSGILEKKAYRDDPNHPEEEYFTKLKAFNVLKKPLPASEIKQITGVNYRFMSTMFNIDAESGERIWKHILENCL